MDKLKQQLIGLLVGFEVALFGCVYFLAKGKLFQDSRVKFIIIGVLFLIAALAAVGVAFYLTKHIIMPNKFKKPEDTTSQQLNNKNDYLSAFRNSDGRNPSERKNITAEGEVAATRQRTGNRPQQGAQRPRPVDGTRSTRSSNGTRAPQGGQRPVNRAQQGAARPQGTRTTRSQEASRPQRAARPQGEPRPQGAQRPQSGTRPQGAARPSRAEGARNVRKRPTND